MSDNTEALVDRLRQREERGLSKYRTTLDRTDMEPGEWIQHAQDEALDLAAYLEGLKNHRFPRDETGDRELLRRCSSYFLFLDRRGDFNEEEASVRQRLIQDIGARFESEKSPKPEQRRTQIQASRERRYIEVWKKQRAELDQLRNSHAALVAACVAAEEIESLVTKIRTRHDADRELLEKWISRLVEVKTQIRAALTAHQGK